MSARVYAVTAAGRDAGTLTHDMAELLHRRWRWRSASGALDTFFPTKTGAKDFLSWICRCRPIDVQLVEQEQEAAWAP